MVSAWRQYALTHLDPALLTILIQLIEEFVKHRGRSPTAAEVQAYFDAP